MNTVKQLMYKVVLDGEPNIVVACFVLAYDAQRYISAINNANGYYSYKAEISEVTIEERKV